MEPNSQPQPEPENSKPPPMPIVANSRGLQLATLDDMWRFAECVSQSGLAPTNLQSPSAILVAMQLGAELGLTPMASLRNIAVINGRPSIWGDAQLALCRRSGKFDETGFAETYDGSLEAGTLAAKCQVKRTDSPDVSAYIFSTADAKLAGLWGKGGPWTQYPKRMLRYRARAFALRDAFTDVLFGFLTAEEAQDLPPREVVSEVVKPKLGTNATLERIKKGPTKVIEPRKPEDVPEPEGMAPIADDVKQVVPHQKQQAYNYNLGALKIAELVKLACGWPGDRDGRTLTMAERKIAEDMLKEITGSFSHVKDMPMDATLYERTIAKLEARVEQQRLTEHPELFEEEPA